MESEEVVVAEVKEESEEEEDLGRPRRRITAGPIIVIVVLAIIIGFVVIWAVIPPEVEEIHIVWDYLDKSDGSRYGIFVEIYVSGGWKTIEGTGSLDVLHNGSNVHSRQVPIIDEIGRVELEFKDFIMENGDHTLSFSMEGISKTNIFDATMVPDELEISVQNLSEGVVLTITPKGLLESASYYSGSYDISSIIEDPSGEKEEITRSLSDWNEGNRSLTAASKNYRPEEMGEYTFSAELTNNLVKETSPYRVVKSTPEKLTQFRNQPPILDEIDVPSRVHIDEEFTLKLDADDPDTNGRIVYYSIDWGVEGEDIEFIEIEEGESEVARVTHSYPDVDDYIITITCADNGPIGPLIPPDNLREYNYQRFDTDTYQISVRRFG